MLKNLRKIKYLSCRLLSMFWGKLWSLPFLSQKSCVGMMFHFRPESLELRSLGLSQVAPFQTSTKFHQITPLQTPLQSTNYQNDNNWLGTNLMYLKQFWETKKYFYRQTLRLSLKCRTTTRSPRTLRWTRWPRPPCTPPPPPWRAPGEGEWKRLSRRVATLPRLNSKDNTCWNTTLSKYTFSAGREDQVLAQAIFCPQDWGSLLLEVSGENRQCWNEIQRQFVQQSLTPFKALALCSMQKCT